MVPAPLPPSPPISSPEQRELFPGEAVSYRDGRDELNLAEFPISTIGTRFDPMVKTLTFEDRAVDKDTGEIVHRKLTITASDQHGLPTAADDEVLLGLLQISRLQRFESPTVLFTPYQLLRLLDWRVNTGNYRRLRESIERWLGVTLHYQNAWRDKQTGNWIDAGFHFLESVEFHKRGSRGGALAPEGLSMVRWNDLVFRNMRAGNLKTLDFHRYRTLQGGIAKRLFRFLDKRFYHRRRLTFNLESFACEKIGLTRPVRLGGGRPTTDVAQIKRRLLPAIRELEGGGFLVARPDWERFTKEPGTGTWQVHFERAAAADDGSARLPAPVGEGEGEAQPSLGLDVADISPVEGRLIGHGVSPAQARRLASEHDAVRVEAQLEALEHLLIRGGKAVPENRAGWLVQAVTENYSPPRGFRTRAQREHAAQEKARRAQRVEERHGQQEAREQDEAARQNHDARATAGRVEAYLGGYRKRPARNWKPRPCGPAPWAVAACPP